MEITRKQFIKGLAASAACLKLNKFSSIAKASGTTSKRKILFVYVPTGTTHRFFPDDIGTAIGNRWTTQEKVPLEDKHFNYILDEFKDFKENMILFHGLSPYGGGIGQDSTSAPRNHFEGNPEQSGGGDGGGPSTVFTGGGGYHHSASSKKSSRKLMSLDHYFFKKANKELNKYFSLAVCLQGNSQGRHISFDGETCKLIPDVDQAIDSFNKIICASLPDLSSCSSAASPSISEADLIQKVIDDNNASKFKDVDIFSNYMKAMKEKKASLESLSSRSFNVGADCAKIEKHNKRDETSFTQAAAAVSAVKQAFICGVEICTLQFGKGHVAESDKPSTEFFYTGSNYGVNKHHPCSHYNAAGESHGKIRDMFAYENTHKKIMRYIKDIANHDMPSGKKLHQEVLIVVSSCLGEDASSHSGANTPCLLIGGDPTILDHGKYYNYLFDINHGFTSSSFKNDSLASKYLSYNLQNTGNEINDFIQKNESLNNTGIEFKNIVDNLSMRCRVLRSEDKGKTGGYNKFLNSICYYMGYPPKKDILFKNSDAFGFLDSGPGILKPESARGRLNIFKDDINVDEINPNWG
jgi:hypothetical protein